MNFDYITFRDVGNAGDNLIGWALQRLVAKEFIDDVKFNIVHLARDDYRESCAGRNILFGPGGIISGSPDENRPDILFLRGITSELLAEWRRDGKNIFFFGSGTNSSSGHRPFTEESGKLLNELVSSSRYLYVRGTADIHALSAHIDDRLQYKFRFQPCPSIFLDKVFSIKKNKQDRVAINLNFANFSKEEIDVHPIRRFVDYVKSLGLTPVLFANLQVDINDALEDVFEGHYIYNSPKYAEKDIRRTKRDNKTAPFTNSMHTDRVLAKDFNGFRFSFGKRLHGFLPFASFGAVPVFLTNRAVRKQIPMDYFGLPELLVPFQKEDAEASVDAMIDRLKELVSREDELVSRITEERGRLYRLTQKNLNEMEDLCE